MKKCFKCGLIKNIDDFYIHNEMADGHLNKCKECTIKDVRERGLLEKNKIKEYDLIRDRSDKRKKLRREKCKKFRKENKEKHKAHTAVSNAVRDGRIKKSNKCEICDKVGLTEGHHEDYSKPLDVIWICVKCHRQIHLKRKRIINL